MLHRRLSLTVVCRYYDLERDTRGVLLFVFVLLFVALVIAATAELLSKDKILTALPLWGWWRHRGFIIFGPAVIFVILAVRHLELGLRKFSFRGLHHRHFRQTCRGVMCSMVGDARYAVLNLHVSVKGFEESVGRGTLTWPITKPDTSSIASLVLLPSSF